MKMQNNGDVESILELLEKDGYIYYELEGGLPSWTTKGYEYFHISENEYCYPMTFVLGYLALCEYIFNNNN